MFQYQDPPPRTLHKADRTPQTQFLQTHPHQSPQGWLSTLLAWSEAHGSQNLIQVISREKFLFLGVKQIKAVFQALNFIHLQTGNLIDLIIFNACIRIFASHLFLLPYTRSELTTLPMYSALIPLLTLR
eukprot:TRINITY_DN3494_c0_g1_i2.p1 TRINITY_DN3494_c0_g1~~TRINITY_DN3494_c0_g1_i2.p1  ORF type:complete len:129 (-),score=21.96 TRINITY_DN3494_c0_g1_i2:104-490(-)